MVRGFVSVSVSVFLFYFILFFYFYLVSLFACVINDHGADDFIIISLIILGGCTKRKR